MCKCFKGDGMTSSADVTYLYGLLNSNKHVNYLIISLAQAHKSWGVLSKKPRVRYWKYLA